MTTFVPSLVSGLVSSLEAFLLSYLANALWQVPLLFAAGWAAARALRRLGAGAEHRVWVGALLLQTLLPACSAIPWKSLRTLLIWAALPTQDAQPHVAVVMGAGTAFGGIHLPTGLLAAITIAYAAVTAYFAARFAWRLRSIRALRLNSSELVLPAEAVQQWAQCSQTFAIAHASVAASSQVFGPVTIGIARKLVLIPARMLHLPDAEMCAAIAHEFAHMRRNDFLKNLIYEALSLPVAFHPMLRLTRQHLMESREMVCDQMAAEIGEPHQYARSLLRLASLLVDGTSSRTRTPHAIGIFDATTFERRVMKLTRKQPQVSARRQVAAIALSIVLGLATCASALALSFHVDPTAAVDENKASSPHDPVNVSPEKMAAQLVSKTTPVYPPDAKKARIQGTVKLDAVISKTGEVEQLKVISGPDVLQQSSLDAVRKWTYKPFLLNGDPVEVKTTINIVFSLKK